MYVRIFLHIIWFSVIKFIIMKVLVIVFCIKAVLYSIDELLLYGLFVTEYFPLSPRCYLQKERLPTCSCPSDWMMVTQMFSYHVTSQLQICDTINAVIHIYIVISVATL